MYKCMHVMGRIILVVHTHKFKDWCNLNGEILSPEMSLFLSRDSFQRYYWDLEATGS